MNIASMHARDSQMTIVQSAHIAIIHPSWEQYTDGYDGLNLIWECGADRGLAPACRYFELGRAGGMYTVQAALMDLGAGRERVLVGGIDTCLDLTWLARLDREQRLIGSDVKDGFMPGEGAAFLMLSRASRDADGVCTTIVAAGHGR